MPLEFEKHWFPILVHCLFFFLLHAHPLFSHHSSPPFPLCRLSPITCKRYKLRSWFWHVGTGGSLASLYLHLLLFDKLLFLHSSVKTKFSPIQQIFCHVHFLFNFKINTQSNWLFGRCTVLCIEPCIHHHNQDTEQLYHPPLVVTPSFPTQPLATTDLFFVPVVLSFQEYPINENMQYVNFQNSFFPID